MPDLGTFLTIVFLVAAAIAVWDEDHRIAERFRREDDE